MRYAAYCRVSTGSEEQLNSLVNQSRFFEEYVINTYEKTDEDREQIRKEYKSKHEYNQNQSIFESYNRIKIVIEECFINDNHCKYSDII